MKKKSSFFDKLIQAFVANEIVSDDAKDAGGDDDTDEESDAFDFD